MSEDTGSVASVLATQQERAINGDAPQAASYPSAEFAARSNGRLPRPLVECSGNLLRRPHAASRGIPQTLFVRQVHHDIGGGQCGKVYTRSHCVKGHRPLTPEQMPYGTSGCWRVFAFYKHRRILTPT